MPSNNIIGGKIKYFRIKKGLTQKQLASLIGKTESSIQKYECGNTEIPLSVLEKIAKYLDTELVFLLDNDYLSEFQKYLQKNGNIELSNIIDIIVKQNIKLDNDITNGYIEKITNLLLKLNEQGQEKAIERVEELTEIPKYQITDDTSQDQE